MWPLPPQNHEDRCCTFMLNKYLVAVASGLDLLQSLDNLTEHVRNHESRCAATIEQRPGNFHTGGHNSLAAAVCSNAAFEGK